MEAPDKRPDIDLKAVETAFKKGLKKTGIRFDVHRTLYDTDFYVHFEYRPLTQVPYGPFIPIEIQKGYNVYSVAAYVDKRSTQHISIHFTIKGKRT